MKCKRVLAAFSLCAIMVCAAGAPATGAVVFQLEKDVPFTMVPARPLPISIHLYASQAAAAPLVTEKVPLSAITISEYAAYGGARAYRLRLNFSQTAGLAGGMDLWWDLDMNGSIVGKRERVPQSAHSLSADEALTADWAADAATLDGQAAGDFAASAHTHPAGDITGGVLPLSQGGTGATTAPAALANLGAAASSHTHIGADVTSGTVPDADTLDGQHGAFYQNASNLNTGTLADARLSGNVAMQSDLTALAAQLAALTNQLTNLEQGTQTVGYPVLLETESLGSARKPHASTDPSGNAVAVWYQRSTGDVDSVFAGRYTPAAGWSTPVLLEADNTGHARSPRVGMADNGDAVAAWEQFDGVSFNVMANNYTAATDSWSPVPQAVDSSANDGGTVDLAVDPAGNAVVVWEQSDGTALSVWANLFAEAGEGWQGAGLLELSNTGAAGVPRVAMDDAGNAVVVWQLHDGAVDSVWTSLYSAGSPGWESGSWSAPALLEADNAGNASYPQVSMNASGSAIVVWEQSDGAARTSVWSNSYTPGSPDWGTGTWSGPVLVETDDSNDALEPKVALDPSGNAIAVWRQDTGMGISAWGNVLPAGGAWGTPVLIEQNGYVPTKFEVAADTAGDFVAVWQQGDGMRENIWSNRYTGASGWGTAKLVETDNAGDAVLPRLAIDSSGNVFVVWQQNDGALDNIWANRF